jgi:hypothetical protein
MLVQMTEVRIKDRTENSFQRKIFQPSPAPPPQFKSCKGKSKQLGYALLRIV